MKKTFFMYTYNSIIFLFASSLVVFVLSSLAKWLAYNFSNSEVSLFRQLSNGTNYVSTYLFNIAFSLIIIVLTLIAIELFNRFRNDKITNYFKSIYQTLILRHFLIQRERTEKVMSIENQTISTYNPINKQFNRSVGKSTVDIREDIIVILMNVPRTQQAQKLLKEMEPQIKEEISTRNPDYYFSAPTRFRNALWFEGKKR